MSIGKKGIIRLIDSNLFIEIQIRFKTHSIDVTMQQNYNNLNIKSKRCTFSETPFIPSKVPSF